MTQFDIEKGFWYYKPGTDFPPKGIDSIEYYQHTERLNLFLSTDKQVKDWCKHLPKLDKVTFLWVTSNVNQELFDSICQMQNLICLHIEKTTVKNIEAINKLEKMVYLRLSNFTKIESIKSLESLKNIEILTLENLKKVSDFKVVGNLKKLRGLAIDGSMFDKQTINDIDFVTKLSDLKYLMFINTKILNINFDPILNLERLETFKSSLNYPKAEFEKLKLLPSLRNTNIPDLL